MRNRTNPTLKTYSAMVATRLRELRDEHGLTMEQFRDKLAEHGIKHENGDRVPQSNTYNWERGTDNKGSGIPLDYFPIIAKIYGFDSPHGWLPDEFPS